MAQESQRGGPGEPEEGQEEGQEEGEVKARRKEVVEGEPQPSSKSAIQSSKKPLNSLILYVNVKSTFKVVVATRT